MEADITGIATTTCVYMEHHRFQLSAGLWILKIRKQASSFLTLLGGLKRNWGPRMFILVLRPHASQPPKSEGKGLIASRTTYLQYSVMDNFFIWQTYIHTYIHTKSSISRSMSLQIFVVTIVLFQIFMDRVSPCNPGQFQTLSSCLPLLSAGIIVMNGLICPPTHYYPFFNLVSVPNLDRQNLLKLLESIILCFV